MCASPGAYAHGALVEVTQSSVAIKATFDNGDPMTDAQVLIYAPTDLESPWTTGKTDGDGQFSFVPEADIEGTWEVTVRKAGHGGTTTFSVGDTNRDPIARSPETNVSPSNLLARRWVTIAATVWGFVGTALFFSAKSSGGKA